MWWYFKSSGTFIDIDGQKSNDDNNDNNVVNLSHDAGVPTEIRIKMRA